MQALKFPVQAATLCMLAQLAWSDGWVNVAKGVEFTEVTLPTTNGKEFIRLSTIRAAPAHVHIRVISSIATMEAAGRAYSAFTLRELVSETRPIAAINGAFIASFSYPLPAGLVLDRGTIHGRLNRESRLQSGILCIGNNGVSLIKTSDYRQGACDSALQSGPRVIEKGGINGIHVIELQRQRFPRSLVCIDDSNRLLFLQTSPAHLYDLAEALRRKGKHNFACDTALNLAGDIESGMLVNGSSGQRSFGVVRSTLASAVLILAK